jgi:hypothetical protein
MDPYIQGRLKQLRAQGFSRVRAQSSGRRDECELCRTLNGIIYSIEEFPTYPPPGCECVVGCGCVVVGMPGNPSAMPPVGRQPGGDTAKAGIQVTESAAPDCTAGLML